SDAVGYDEWERLGVRRDPRPEAVGPADRTDELLAPFRGRPPESSPLFHELLPESNLTPPADSLADPIDALRLASDIDNRTFNAVEVILHRNPTQPFLAVYLDGLDAAEHGLWPYAFPGDFPDSPPAPEDVRRLGPVLHRYVHYMDRRLAAVLKLYDVEPNV